MEEKYRELFDEVYASARLRTEVMDMTEEKRPRRMHTALAAALVAAALTGTVLAAGVATGFDIVRFINGEETMTCPDENGEERELGVIYEVRSDGMSFFLESDMPEAYHAAKQEGADDPDIRYISDYIVDLNKTSWAEAEEFLGMELANSRVIEERGALGRFGMRYDDSSDTVKYNIRVSLFRSGRNYVDAFFRVYRPEEKGERRWGMVDMRICILTDAIAPDLRDDVTWAGLLNDGERYGGREYTREDYVTANGLETVIIKMESVEEDFFTNCGIFVLNGMGYQLSVTGADNDAFLKELLDGFQ